MIRKPFADLDACVFPREPEPVYEPDEVRQHDWARDHRLNGDWKHLPPLEIHREMWKPQVQRKSVSQVADETLREMDCNEGDIEAVISEERAKRR